MNNFELWPRAKLDLRGSLSLRKIKIVDIEDRLKSIYPNTFPVLMPSGRSSINLIVNYLNLSRLDCVLAPFFSSHCVINAIGMSTNVTPFAAPHLQMELVHHQWGFPTSSGFSGDRDPVVILEDSVDTLFYDEHQMFFNNGEFEILSLPKIFSTLIGGVIFCQEESTANELLKLRNGGKSSKSFHNTLRTCATIFPSIYQYWAAIEPHNRSLPDLFLNDISRKIENFADLCASRRSKIDFLKMKRLPTQSCIPETRGISCWPLPVAYQHKLKNSHLFSIKHFRDPDSTAGWAKVYPIPLHNEIDIATLEKEIKF